MKKIYDKIVFEINLFSEDVIMTSGFSGDSDDLEDLNGGSTNSSPLDTLGVSGYINLI